MAKYLGTYTATGIAQWASYLINGDGSGMSDADIAECDAWLAFHQPDDRAQFATVTTTDEESYIARFYDCSNKAPSWGLQCDVLDYTFIRYERT